MALDTVAYLWLVDGLEVAFTNDERVTDAYVATLGEFTRAFPGLRLPTALPAGLDLLTGLLEDTSATFTIDDVDGSLASLFRGATEDAAELLVNIEPGDVGPAATYNMHVGTELFGPAGERRRCSCVPGFNVGLSHAGTARAAALGVEPTPVSSTASEWPGRRCALYRLVQDSAGDWPDLTNDAARASALVWWGTLLGQGSPMMRTWSLKCAGPESWLMGNLGTYLPKESIGTEALLSIDVDKGEHFMSATLLIVDLLDQAQPTDHLYSSLEDTTSLVGATSYDDVVTAIGTLLAAVEADVTNGLAFSTMGTSALRVSTSAGNDGLMVQWDRLADGYASASTQLSIRLTLQLHEKIWRTWGYEPSVQNSERDPVDNEDQYGQFYVAPETNPGAWRGRFYSANAKAMLAFETNDPAAALNADFYNGGFERRWPPIYPGGAQVFDMDQPGQEFRLTTYDPLYLEGSKACPLMAALDDPTSPYSIGGSVGAVTHVGFMAFRGPYRRAGDADTFKAPAGYVFPVERERTEGKVTQVARVCWRAVDGEVALDSTSRPRFVIMEWLDPRIYGIDFERVTGSWASWRLPPANAQPLTARPLAVFEHSREGDSVPYVLARLMASTGRAGGWYTDDTLTTPAYGLGGSPVLDVGANDLGLAPVGDDLLGRFTDAEPPGLALAVPSSMVATGDDTTSTIERALQDFGTDPIYRCKAVFADQLSTRKLIGDLLAPSGLCMSLAGGRFSVFDPWTWRAPTTTGVVTSEDFAGESGDITGSVPEQSLRSYGAPIDKLELDARIDPTSGSFLRRVVRPSSDFGSVTRAQSIVRRLTGAHLMHPSTPANGADWPSTLVPRWTQGFQFWSRQHFPVTFTIAASRHAEFWPGDIVSLTSPWTVNPLGSYGVVKAPGYVVNRTVNAKGETVEVECIVSADALVLYATAAELVRYDDNEDAEGYRLFVLDDAYGFRNGTSFDADGFVEPAWSTLGGNALIELVAFDGVDYVGGIYGEVESIDTTTPGGTWIKLTGALTGATLYRDRHHLIVLRDAVDQTAAWVSRIYAPLCDKDGTSNGTLGKKWKG